jgi:hypothetical protein
MSAFNVKITTTTTIHFEISSSRCKKDFRGIFEPDLSAGKDLYRLRVIWEKDDGTEDCQVIARLLTRETGEDVLWNRIETFLLGFACGREYGIHKK